VVEVNVKQGDRIVLTAPMESDPDGIPVGSKGTVTHINVVPTMGPHGGEWAQISVDWDNGRSLILLDTDSFARVEQPTKE